ncbi:hypothetical protein [Dyadobacter pollutisoli]|uniref:Uncharacterized protein n=1 Tax=Dyadobacter pollutisoli TaxID=2910158 RepID=A0A9E8SMA4_9BACT|nr:hypothetical protein [Dyadobacter pollutisoli]WAC13109.1 hypothetical protein ON006_03925 [Dyadobacter pollutisoli]
MAPATWFDKWKKNGLLEKINQALSELDRKFEAREEWLSILSIDSQSVKLSSMIYENRGIDANKKVNAGPPAVVNDNYCLIVADDYGMLMYLLLTWEMAPLAFS